MISQKTAIALSSLYGSYFGRSLRTPYRQNRATNNKLADFLYKLGLPDSFRQDAKSQVSPNQVKEFMLKFCTGDILDESDEDMSREEREELAEALPLLLAESILNEVKPYIKSADDSFRAGVSAVLRCFETEGHYFYEGGLFTNAQLVDKFGVFYNPETKAFVKMSITNQNPESTVPTAERLLLEVPLYKSYEVDPDSFARIAYQLGSGQITTDSYCVNCELSSTFKRTSPRHYYTPGTKISGYLEVTLQCTRNESHVMKFFFVLNGNSIIKVGQFPSVADLVQRDVKKYRKILGEKYTEFTRAIGLAAHGVGVGSFVYLRRIFEDLISKAYGKAVQNAEWRQQNEQDFRSKRMSDKILALQQELPESLVQNRDIYGIVSKGIHELTEEECLSFFPIMKTSIELILDEELERLSKERKTALTAKAISEIKSKLNGE